MTNSPASASDAPRPAPPRCINLGHLWEELQQVRGAVEEYLEGFDADFRAAAVMTALELCENVFKHGAIAHSGMVTIKQNGGALVISTQNRVDTHEKAEEVVRRIERIAAGQARELFIAGMLEAVNNPDRQGSGLGLLRIAYEGEFQLSCEVMDDRLHIRAERPMEHALPS